MGNKCSCLFKENDFSVFLKQSKEFSSKNEYS